ncbi:hypothetical protein MTR_8g080390 [Medicago truncatula]|uniref:Uncharacterized protein n=1 Tax=Medicago truncatula TaxID=3880 RepID=A0A072U415_MEDTR|nr:hypothetical protein MTR_8g080390 [Medicago truncatula]
MKPKNNLRTQNWKLSSELSSNLLIHLQHTLMMQLYHQECLVHFRDHRNSP